MKILIIIGLFFIASCRCKNKAKVLQERQEQIAEIEKKHGKILPPLIEDVPDFSECSS